MTSFLTWPGQVRLVQCSIYSPGLELRAQNSGDAAQLKTYGFDVSQYAQQIDIYESIWDNTISGEVTMLENVGLTEYLPLIGTELFSLSFEIDGTDGTTRQFSRVFRIIGLKDQSFPRHDWRLYKLVLVTNEFVQSVSSRICRAYHAYTCEAAVTDILQRDLGLGPPNPVGLITDEKTFGTVDIVIPNYMPLQAINYFTVLSQTIGTPHESNFLFFETLDGFHFTSIANLITTGKSALDNATLATKLTFYVDPGQISTAPTVLDTTVLNSITKIHQDQGFDVLSDIAGGMLRNRMTTFDFLSRVIPQDTDATYDESFPMTTHLNPNPVYPQNFSLTVSPNVRLFTVPYNVWSTQSAYISSIEQQPQQLMYQAVILRNRQLREIRHTQTLLDLPGQPDLRAGTVVIINYPSTRFLNPSASTQSINVPFNPVPTEVYSGYHLVTSVHHILITKGPGSMEYRMNLRVNKDSLNTLLIGTSDMTDPFAGT